MDLIFVLGIEIDLIFVCGPKMTCFGCEDGDRLTLFFLWVVENDLVLYAV